MSRHDKADLKPELNDPESRPNPTSEQAHLKVDPKLELTRPKPYLT